MSSSIKNARVGLIGRPNVGKSTLFNLLTHTRKAIVKNQPGVARDVIVEPAEWWGQQFDVVDMGGVTEAKDTFSLLIRDQVVETLQSLDILIVVMDGRIGLVPEDRDIVRIAVESGKPFLIAVNKVDRPHEADLMLSEFYEFGRDVVATSFEQGYGVDEVVEWIKDHLETQANIRREGVRLAIVGKPNVGKSSMCNFLLDEKRMLVSDIAGTTVDAIEAQFHRGDKNYILVDTAGVRKQAKRNQTGDGVEILSAYKSHEAIEKADIVLLMVDATMGPTDQDTKLTEYIVAQNKAVILVANKSDVAKATMEAHRLWFREKVAREFHFFPDLPIVFTSAVTGSGVDQLFEKIDETWDKLKTKVSTSSLNKFFYEVIRQAPAPVYKTRNVRFYYLTQTGQMPPSFIAFANHPEGVTPAYRRFLTKRLQNQFDLQGIPIRMHVMKSRNL
ncbi:MAG: ribosome biogenesis GTPase Der [Bdellovibrionales bacterium]|nr:ribosome biogenesis GTPase Der [Bdellovibrionales bacterium]